jgi:hypothetical protein
MQNEVPIALHHIAVVILAKAAQQHATTTPSFLKLCFIKLKDSPYPYP